VDKVFLGTTGVSLDRGYSTPNPLEAQTKRAMILAAKERFVLADASKLGHATLSSFAKLEEVNVLITSGNVPEEFKHGLEVLDQRFRIANLE
jgi:DeoR/GlpR family transcriptional regulator of sugar metabolism